MVVVGCNIYGGEKKRELWLMVRHILTHYLKIDEKKLMNI